MNKSKQVVVRLTEEEKRKFEEYCKQEDESFQRILRKYIKSLIK